MSETISYIGKDLEAMSFAPNYHGWILDEFRPYFGQHFVEVGAGTGSFSQLLLRERPRTLFLVEPSEMFHNLVTNLSAIRNEVNVAFHNRIFSDVPPEAFSEQPDSIFYVNVLEHIDDDRRELKLIFDTLADGGRCFVFVPALMSLYGDFDRKIGHFRRYRKREVEEKFTEAGFRIVHSKYFDIAGILPWYVKYRVFGSDSLDRESVLAYDRLAVPFLRRIELAIRVPIGKNILVVGEK
jgi:SAM-dependent methyltransferase